MRSETQSTIASNVDEYLARLPADVRKTLEKTRAAIRKAAPKAEELISYHIPTYKWKGALVHFAAFKNHCSFFGVSKVMLRKFEDQLKAFRISGTTIHFTPENPLPARVISALVKARLAENETRELLREQEKLQRAKGNSDMNSVKKNTKPTPSKKNSVRKP